MENNIETKNKYNKLISILGIILVILIGAGVVYFLGLNKNEKIISKEKVTPQIEIIENDKQLQSNLTKNTEENYTEGEDENNFQAYYIIANDAFLRSQPMVAEINKIKKLKFGDKFYAKNDDNQSEYKKVYLNASQNDKNPTKQVFYVLASVLVDEYSFKDYKENFSLEPFSGLASKTKKIILNENNSNGNSYYLSQNAERAKATLAYGDYDSDGIMDIAIVLDNNEKQTTRLLVICTNKATKDPYLAFAENFSDKIIINSFKKGAKIFMYKQTNEAARESHQDEDEQGFSKAPNDGVIIKGEDVKIAIIYSKNLQKFKTYYQE